MTSVQKSIILTEELRTKLGKLDLFPGSLQEYNDFKGGKYKIMDTGTQEKCVYFEPNWLKEGFMDKMRRPIHLDDMLKPIVDLVEAGCEALIRYDTRGSYYKNGMPVKEQ